MSNVYIIASVKDDKMVAPTKVGRSDMPYSRLSALQTGSPIELAIYAYFVVPTRDAAVTIERWFRENNNERRNHGEWYNIAPSAAYSDVLREIKIYLKQEYPDLLNYEKMLELAVSEIDWRDDRAH